MLDYCPVSVYTFKVNFVRVAQLDRASDYGRKAETLQTPKLQPSGTLTAFSTAIINLIIEYLVKATSLL